MNAPDWQAELATLGPFFAVETHETGSATLPWRGLDELITDSAAVAARVGTIRHGLAAAGGRADEDIEERVAASVAHLGLVSRLVSPALAVAAGYGLVLELAPETTWWQPVSGGPVPVSVARPGSTPAGDAAELFVSRVLDGPVRALGDAFARFSVSPKILWGNVASAVHGAAVMLDRERPEWTDTTRSITAVSRAVPPLLGSGDLIDGRFRRRSCCLIYRIAPDHQGPYCGDCVLA